MKIILISTYSCLGGYGTRIISRCLKNAGHQVKIVFLNQEQRETIGLPAIEDLSEICSTADLIGVSLMTDSFDRAVQVTTELKKRHSTPIIWGGIHPTIRPEECLQYADIVCVGEGESAVVELAAGLEKGTDISSVAGLCFKDEDEIKCTPQRDLIQNLDEVPYPDYEVQDHYVVVKGRLQVMSTEYLAENMPRFYFKTATYLSIPSRGCPFSCSYCVNSTLNKIFPSHRKIRQRSPENLITELVEAKRKMPFIGSILFDDDAFFTYSLEDIKLFSREYKEKINLPLRIGGATPSILSEEKLALLVDAGLTNLRLGIQSGSRRIQTLYKRKQTNDEILAAAKIINKFKATLLPDYDVILDNPWETDEDKVETLRFLAKLPIPYSLGRFSLKFYPETELYHKAVAEGRIKDDIKDVYKVSFHEAHKTFLNSLYVLLAHCSPLGIKLSDFEMYLLTNPLLRKIGFSKLFYHAEMLRSYVKIGFAIVSYSIRKKLYSPS